MLFRSITLGPFKYLEDNNNLIKSEINSLRAQNKWLDDSLQLRYALQDRTAGKWAWVERYRNDMARLSVERKLEQKGTRTFETKVGGAIHTLYQDSMFSPMIRMVDRGVDDIPRTVINFNDPVQTPNRLRTNLRAATVHAGMLPEDTLDIYNRFITAPNETVKLTIVKEYTDKLGKYLADKYNIHGSKLDTILEAYDKAHMQALNMARQAYSESTGFAIRHDGEIIEDPQLISQLAKIGRAHV